MLSRSLFPNCVFWWMTLKHTVCLELITHVFLSGDLSRSKIAVKPILYPPSFPYIPPLSVLKQNQNHLGWERCIIKAKYKSNTVKFTIKLASQYHIHTSFNYLWGWWLIYFPGQLATMPDNPISDEHFF